MPCRESRSKRVRHIEDDVRWGPRFCPRLPPVFPRPRMLNFFARSRGPLPCPPKLNAGPQTGKRGARRRVPRTLLPFSEVIDRTKATPPCRAIPPATCTALGARTCFTNARDQTIVPARESRPARGRKPHRYRRQPAGPPPNAKQYGPTPPWAQTRSVSTVRWLRDVAFCRSMAGLKRCYKKQLARELSGYGASLSPGLGNGPRSPSTSSMTGRISPPRRGVAALLCVTGTRPAGQPFASAGCSSLQVQARSRA